MLSKRFILCLSKKSFPLFVNKYGRFICSAMRRLNQAYNTHQVFELRKYATRNLFWKPVEIIFSSTAMVISSQILN